MEEYRKKVESFVNKNQFVSVMNNTKWLELQIGVMNHLSFTPPYQVKFLLEEFPHPLTFDEDVWFLGDWLDGLYPFYSIEWLRVRPRYLKHIGQLVDPEVIELTEEFRSLLTTYHIPFEEKENSFFIYGYIRPCK